MLRAVICPNPIPVTGALVIGILATGILLAGCGGSGGGGSPAATPARLSTSAVEFAPSATTADLVVSLAQLPAPAPVLLQVAVELPPALTVAPADTLQPLQSVATLRGSKNGSRYVVVCGDDRSAAGAPLRTGALFRVRLLTTAPRQVGEHAITLRDVKLALGDGTEAASDPNPVVVTATVR